jgi:hypothetical protein
MIDAVRGLSRGKPRAVIPGNLPPAAGRLSVPTQAAEPDPQRVSGLSADLGQVLKFFILSILVGLFLVLLSAGFRLTSATPLLWSAACLASGCALGFLFGIPKVLQGDLSSPGAGAPVTAPGPTPAQDAVYRQRVNTNLEEISDWLTKIIVGLSLINLGKIQGAIGRLSRILASELDPPNKPALAGSLIVYFSVVGLLFGYLITRLFLQRAFARADLAAAQRAFARADRAAQQASADSYLKEQIASASEPVLAASPQIGNEPTEKEVEAHVEAQAEAAERVAQVARQIDDGVVRRQIADLAREYEDIRATMRSGSARTGRMEVVITKMRTLALAGYDLLPELIRSPSTGERLAAVAMLQVKPDAAYLDWLAERVQTERHFMGYHAAVALQYAARILDPAAHERLRQAIAKAKQGLGADTDRFKVLEKAEKELPPAVAP